MTLHQSFLLLKPPIENKDPRFIPDVFDKYFDEVGSRFPNIPREAFEEWIFPFWGDHIAKLYGSLDFRRFVFNLESWTVPQCLSIQWYSWFRRVVDIEEKWTIEHFNEGYRYHTQAIAAWKEQGTWFKPIWVLDADTCPSDHLHPEVKKPFMLIEGHSRLGALRLHHKHGLAAPSHKVWVVKATE